MQMHECIGIQSARQEVVFLCENAHVVMSAVQKVKRCGVKFETWRQEKKIFFGRLGEICFLNYKYK